MPSAENEEFSRLNRQFYRSEPAAILVMKLNLLIFAASSSVEDLSATIAGSTFESLSVRVADDAPVDENDQRALQSYLISETHSLWYQASECLMRLYLTHAGGGECPWIELAKLRTGHTFNETLAWIAKRITDVSGDVAEVFTGGYPDVDTESLVAAERFLRLTADRLGTARNLHNSTKHGLGIVPGRTGLGFFRDEDGAEMFSVDGPSIVYLERASSDATPGQTDWHESTEWISLRRTMWLTRLAITQIDALWTIAKWRYLGMVPDRVELMTNDGIDIATTGVLADPHLNTKFKRSVGFERK